MVCIPGSRFKITLSRLKTGISITYSFAEKISELILPHEKNIILLVPKKQN